LDDFLIAPLADVERRDLLELLEERYNRGSTTFTSQRPNLSTRKGTRRGEVCPIAENPAFERFKPCIAEESAEERFSRVIVVSRI
jgi:hypothetical protein